MRQYVLTDWLNRCRRALIRQSARPGLHWKLAISGLLAMLLAQPPHIGSLLTYTYGTPPPGVEGGVWQVTEAFKRQIAHPFSPDLLVAPGSHAAKTAFRLTPPLLARILHLNHLGLWLLQLALGLLLLIGAYHLLREALRDRAAALLAAHGLCFVYFGYAAGYDIAINFDPLAYAALIGAMWSRRPAVVAACVLAGAFTDERFVLVTGVVLLWHGWRATGGRGLPGLRGLLLRPAALAVAVGLLVYGGLRLTLAVVFGLQTHTVAVGLECLRYHLESEMLPMGLLTSLETYWLLLGAGVLALLLARRWRELGLLLLALVPVVTAALIVFDLTRSLAYLTPAALLGAALARPALPLRAARQLALVVWLGAGLLPSYILSQTLVSAGSWSHSALGVAQKVAHLVGRR